MTTGHIVVCGFNFSASDIEVKREFKGDKKLYEACVSEDGSLIVAIDTTCDEEVMQELRARTLASTVQKMRKSAGLVVADKVEIFFMEAGFPIGGPISSALFAHADATIKRIKTYPLPLDLRPKNSQSIIAETVKDADISKNDVQIVLTRPCVSVNTDAVLALLSSLTTSSSSNTESAPLAVVVDMISMYLQTLDYDTLLSEPKATLIFDSFPQLTLEHGKHYFSSALDMIKSVDTIRKGYSHL